MVNIIPLADTITEINLWTSVALPIVASGITALIFGLVTKLLDRSKNNAEERKLTAEEKKLKAETSSIENEEWQRLYAEIKSQYTNLKKDSDEQIQTLKKESEEQMGFLKKQISLHSDTLELQSANFETQEQTIEELKKELEIEKKARLRLETVIKKFQQWAVRNKEALEKHGIEPVPVLETYL